jgi:phosphomannomutase/phosphoglucomutase
MTVFRAYDIRGIYPKELNEDLAHKIGLAFGKFLGEGSVAIGMDPRKGGASLKKAFINGITDRGIDIIDIGMVPSPVLYFAVKHLNLSGGIAVTASHNPKDYNGFKLVGPGGVAFNYENCLGKLERDVGSIKPSGKKGRVEMKDIRADYASFVLSRNRMGRKMRIVIDSGNGSTGPLAKHLFKDMGFDVVCLYCEPDGTFPNHHPNPVDKETLKDLQKKVKSEKADIGIAFDGDGDRIGFVDESGNIIEDNRIGSLMAKDILKRKPGSKILYEVLCSKVMEDTIRKHGGVPVLSRVGHSYIHHTMVEKNCEFGAETSGHYFFRENAYFDDGLFAAARVLEIVSKSGKRISELVGELPFYFVSFDTRIECPDESKFKVVDYLKSKFRKEGHKLITIDGVKIIKEHSWCIARASNTQPAIVLRWEADNKEEFQEIGDFIRKEVNEAIKKFR